MSVTTVVLSPSNLCFHPKPFPATLVFLITPGEGAQLGRGTRVKREGSLLCPVILGTKGVGREPTSSEIRYMFVHGNHRLV